jgi:hypothetical protein
MFRNWWYHFRADY